MTTKDYFSGHSKLYATFRPTYPTDLYDFIFSHVENKSTAWDCATGNGQVAVYLSNYFETVFATDISQNQLANAISRDNIAYGVSSAEKTGFTNNQFDLITVGQALHWFNLDEFYNEVKRVAKHNSILAVWGYGVCSVNSNIDKFFLAYYNTTVGPYWDSARKLVEEEYATLPFPFKTIDSPKFHLSVNWTLEQFIGYVSTWSATQKYIKVNNEDPLPALVANLQPHWKPGEEKTITLPIFLKLGKIEK